MSKQSAETRTANLAGSAKDWRFLPFLALIVMLLPLQICLEKLNVRRDAVAFVAIALVLTYLIHTYLQIKYSYWKSLGIPSPPCTPIVGHTLRRLGITMHFKKFFDDAYYNYNAKDICGLYDFLKPAWLIGNLQMVQNIFVNDFDHFANRMIADMTKISPLISNMLPFCVGERWKTMRSSLTPTFTAHKLRLLVPLINEQTDKFVELLKEIAINQEEVASRELCGRYNMDTIASCAFGIECDSIKSKPSEFSKMAYKIFVFSPVRAFKVVFLIVASPFVRLFSIFGSDFSSPEFNFFIKAATRTLKIRKEKGIYRGDFLDLMKENGELTESEMTAQAVLFLLAGYDNTSTMLAFMLHLFAMHPEVQQKIRDEMLQYDYCDKGVGSYEVLSKMPYLEAVFKETLRLYPGTVDLQRVCTKDYVIPGSTTHIRKGQSIFVPVFSIHRDPYYWPQPEEFHPERFLSDYNKLAFLPFSLGPRVCLGRKFAALVNKMAICKILTHLEVIPTANTVDPPPLDPGSFTLKPEKRLPLTFRLL